MDPDAAMALLQDGEYGILSTADENNQPYGIPVNYALMQNRIVFHSATEGRKLENITANSVVSFCVVGKTELIPEEFATRYESVVVSGPATVIEDAELKRAALLALVLKYAPAHISAGKAYIDRLIDRTTVVAIAISDLSGKCRP